MTNIAAPAGQMSGPQPLCAPGARKYVLVAAIIASALGFIDGSMVSIAIPSMRNSLGGSLIEAQWISNAYMLTLCSLMLVGGGAGDRFGLVRVFFWGIVLFLAASMLCAAATQPRFLITARAIQGIGAAFMIPGSLALISRIYPDEQRGAAIGTWAAAAAVTAALGPIMGGVVLTLGGDEAWRWLFMVNLPLGGIALYLLSTKTLTDRTRPGRGVDYAGAFFATLGLGLIAWALTYATHNNTRAALCVFYAGSGLLALVIFLWVEARSPHPMMPLNLFSSTAFSVTNIVSFLVYLAFAAIIFYLPMTIIGAWGISPLKASATFAPLSIFIAALSRSSDRLAKEYGPAAVITVGSLVLALGYGIMASTLHLQQFWTILMPCMCLTGIGMALIVTPLSTAVMSSVSSERAGTASGVNNAASRMAGLISVASMGSVVAARYAVCDGPFSFGEISIDPLHASASNSAFAFVASFASAICVLSAAVTFFALPRVPSRP